MFYSEPCEVRVYVPCTLLLLYGRLCGLLAAIAFPGSSCRLDDVHDGGVSHWNTGERVRPNPSQTLLLMFHRWFAAHLAQLGSSQSVSYTVHYGYYPVLWFGHVVQVWHRQFLCPRRRVCRSPGRRGATGRVDHGCGADIGADGTAGRSLPRVKPHRDKGPIPAVVEFIDPNRDQ